MPAHQGALPLIGELEVAEDLQAFRMKVAIVETGKATAFKPTGVQQA